MIAGRTDRRTFLGATTRSIAGFVLLSAIPPWIRGSVAHTTAYRERSFVTMGSVMTMSVYGPGRREVDEAVNRVVEEFARVERLLSVFDRTSFVSKLNLAAGRNPLPADPDVVELFHSAQAFSESTGGAFDVTVEPLMRRWGFRSETRELKRVPSDRELSDLLGAVGYGNIFLDRKNGLVGLRHPRAAVDLGGIAVGWTIDRAVGILHRYGIVAAFINHAGDAYALGVPEESEGWSVGIPHPDRPGEIIHRMTLRDRAVATSGNYRKFVESDGRRFGHILDPRSGRPGASFLSVTVAAKTALEADAYSTGLYCLGSEKAVRTIDGSLSVICVERRGDRPVLRQLDQNELGRRTR